MVMIRFFVALLCLIPSLCLGATTVPLPITETESVARTGHPVTIGFPMPSDSGVTSVDNVKLIRNSDDQEIDCQKEVTARWSSGGNIKWVLLDFQATVASGVAETPATATYSVVYGTDVAAGSPTDQAVVTTETGYYKVDVGDLEFKVSRTDSLKIYDVVLGAQTMVNSASPWVAKMLIGGVEYNTDNASVYDVSVETDGTERVTIKCTGEFESASAVSKFRHETRITAYAGQDTIRVYHTIVFDEDMYDTANEPSAIYLSTPLQIGSTISAALGGQSTIHTKTGLGASDNYYLHQQLHNTVGTDYGYVYGNDSTIDGNGGKSAGWMDVNDGSYGVTVAMRDFVEKYPAALRIDSKEYQVMMWPGKDYSTIVANENTLALAGTRKLTWPFRGGSNFSLRGTAISGGAIVDSIHNAYGVSNTMEATYYFHSGNHETASSQNTAKAYLKELIAWNPSHVVDTQAIRGLGEVNVTDWPEAESYFEGGFDFRFGTSGLVHQNLFLGIPHYGDFPYTASSSCMTPPGARGWMHWRIGIQKTPWVLFARSGAQKYLTWGIAANRHAMDWDTAHDAIDQSYDNNLGRDWSSEITYAQWDRVNYGGRTYWSKVAGNINNTPALKSSYWGWLPLKKTLGAPTSTHETAQTHWHSLNGWDCAGGACTNPTMDSDMAMDLQTECLYLYYYILGYKRAENVATMIAENYLNTATTESLVLSAERTLGGILNSNMSHYLHTWDTAYKTKTELAFDTWNTHEDWRVNGMKMNNTRDPWILMTTTWPLDYIVDLCTTLDDAECQARFPSFSKAVGGMGLTATASNSYTYSFPMEMYSEGHRMTSDDSYLQSARHYSDVFSAWGDGPTVGWKTGTGDNASYDWVRYVFRMTRLMHYLDGNNLDIKSYNYPTFQSAYVRIPTSGTSCSFYINEATDGEFTTTIGFNHLRSITSMETFYDVGNVYITVYDPDGLEVDSITYDLGYYSTDSSPDYNGNRFEGGRDNWFLPITIPSDGKSGSYKITITAQLGNTAVAYIANNTTGGKIKIPLSPTRTVEVMKDSKYYFHVPSDTTNFTVVGVNWAAVAVHKPDGTRYAVPRDSYNITPAAEDKNKFWALSFYDRDAVSSRTATLTINGAADPDYYVYVNPYNQFDLLDNYGTSETQPGGASSIKIKSDRWPDFETLKTFGDSAATIMGAVTDTEKALAVYRLLQASTVVVGPLPRALNYTSTPLVYGDLLLNIYGGHDCSGLGETMSSIWRAMGNKARTIQPDSGHTQAELAWTDSDSVERYHLFDASGNRLFLWNRAGTNLVSHDDIVLDPSLVWRPENLSKYPTYPKAGVPYSGWWDVEHERYPSRITGTDYSRLFDLRQNESVQLYFGNDTNRLKYVSSGLDQAGGVTDIKHGPYPKVQGTALWTLSPDLTTAGWEDGLESTTNLTTDTGPLVHPTATGTASAVYHFQFPYPVADVEIDADIVRGASDTFKVYVSKDGTTWVEKYAAPSGSTELSAQSLVVDVAGTATGGAFTENGSYDYYTLEDSSKAWTSNELVQVSASHPNSQTDHTVVRNLTTGMSGIAISNTSNSLRCYAEAHPITFTAGDLYSITKWPTSSTPVFGRYDYYLKIEMVAASTPTTVGFSDLTIRNYTQHNLFSLPQLWPVDNDITVSGSVLGGSKLRVTYQWDDEQGSNRQNIAEIVTPPYTYTIKADSAHWPSVNAGINGTGVKCDFIKIECVPKEVGDTNRITTQEAAPSATTDILPTDAYATSDILLGTINTTGTSGYAPPAIRTASQYRSDLATALAANSFTAMSPPGVRWTLWGMMDLNTQDAGERASNKTAINAVMEHLYDYQGTVKPIALAAYCQADNYSSDCVTMCGRVLNRDSDMKWAEYAASSDMSSQLTWIKAVQSAALILSRIGTEEARAYSDEIAGILSLNYFTGAYFKIITGANDTATLTCPAGDGTITLTDGTYTGDQLATEIQTQMNANSTLIDGGSVSYTVTYNSTTRKFTIAASAGTIAYNRTTYKSQLMRDLGWTESATAAASITSNDVTFDNSTYNYLIYCLSRALGNLMDSVGCSSGERAALTTFISGPYYEPLSAEALGKCGTIDDVPALENMIAVAIAGSSGNLKILRPMVAIGKLGDSTDAPQFYSYTTHWDEDFRAGSAEALGKLDNQDAVTYITAARAVEPVGWVQDIQDAALALLAGGEPEPPPPGPYKNHGSPKTMLNRPLL